MDSSPGGTEPSSSVAHGGVPMEREILTDSPGDFPSSTRTADGVDDVCESARGLKRPRSRTKSLSPTAAGDRSGDSSPPCASGSRVNDSRGDSRGGDGSQVVDDGGEVVVVTPRAVGVVVLAPGGGGRRALGGALGDALPPHHHPAADDDAAAASGSGPGSSSMLARDASFITPGPAVVGGGSAGAGLVLSPVSAGHDVRVETELVALGFAVDTVRAAMRAIRDQEGAAVAARCCATVESGGLAPIIGCETFRLALGAIAAASRDITKPADAATGSSLSSPPSSSSSSSSKSSKSSLSASKSTFVPVRGSPDLGLGAPGAITNPEEEAACCICLDPLERGTRAIFITACSHTFHYGCIRSAVESRVPSCPLCRRSFSTMTPPARLPPQPRRSFSSGDLGGALAAARLANRNIAAANNNVNNDINYDNNGNGNGIGGRPMVVGRSLQEPVARLLRGGNAARRARLAEMQRAHREELEARRALERGAEGQGSDAPEMREQAGENHRLAEIAAFMRRAITSSMQVRQGGDNGGVPPGPLGGSGVDPRRAMPEASPNIRSLMARAAMEEGANANEVGVLGDWNFDREVCRIRARIVSHPTYNTGLSITTAKITAVRGRFIETATGSRYRLEGPPESAPDSEAAAQPYDEDNPLLGIAPSEVILD